MSSVSYLPMYDQYFPAAESNVGVPQSNWEALKSKGVDFTNPLSKNKADFSIQDKAKTWQEVAKNIGNYVLKIVIFPWGCYELAKYSVQRFAMMLLYPAQSRIYKSIIFPIVSPNPNAISAKQLDQDRRDTAEFLGEMGCVVRHVTLEKNGVCYSGMLIGHKDTINNGRWALQATGNLEHIEGSAFDMACTYRAFGMNTLLINGPAVGKSEGHATPDSMGDVQALGLSFLETAIKAKKIVLAGRSLGGAAIGSAIMKHQFKPDVKYLVVQQMTFDCASNISAKTVGVSARIEAFIRRLILWCGCEMDTVAASRKLQNLGIKEVIVQATKTKIKDRLPTMEDFSTDGPIIAEASLGYALIKENITDNKVFYCLEQNQRALARGYGIHMTPDAITAAKKEIVAL